jgi:hypothetical protein
MTCANRETVDIEIDPEHDQVCSSSFLRFEIEDRQLTAAALHRLLQGTADDDDGYETASSLNCSIGSLKSSINEYMLENGAFRS